MAVTIPDVPFARLDGRNLSCKEIGGDFFDAVNTETGLGRGAGGRERQGSLGGPAGIHIAGNDLFAAYCRNRTTDVVTGVNRFFTDKRIGEKYATLVIARIRHDGELEYVNCGHVPPLLVCGGEVIRPTHGNMPVGLLPDATYESNRCNLHTGDRLILVTDGVTEAENAEGEFFDNERLEAVAARYEKLQEIFSAVTEFCAGTPLNDDCTVVELRYTGQG